MEVEKRRNRSDQERVQSTYSLWVRRSSVSASACSRSQMRETCLSQGHGTQRT